MDEFTQYCIKILENNKIIKDNIAKNVSNSILLGLSFNLSYQNNISVINNIDAVIIRYLISIGYKPLENKDYPDLCFIEINSQLYSCPNSFLSSTSEIKQNDNELNFDIKKPEVAASFPDISVKEPAFLEEFLNNSEGNVNNEVEQPITEDYVSKDISDNNSSDPYDVFNGTSEDEIDFPYEEDYEETEENEDEIFIEEESESEFESDTESSIENLEEETLDSEDIEEDFSEESDVSMPSHNEDLPSYRVYEENLVYSRLEVNLSHNNSTKKDEAIIVVAPLELPDRLTSTIPIIVSIYFKNKIIIASSYDSTMPGQNIINKKIDDYELLFRGSVNAKGEFQVQISTAGNSIAVGDRIELINQENFGLNRNVEQRIYPEIEYIPTPGVTGNIKVFPFGNLKENEFIALIDSKEFIDYFPITTNYKGTRKNFIIDNGIKKQLICSWENDCLNINLLEG